MAKNRAADSVNARLNALVRELKEISEHRWPRVDVRDTFLVGPFGSVYRRKEAGFDTLWSGFPASEAEDWETVIGSRFRILKDLDRWETFFLLRKRKEDFVLTRKPDKVFNFSVVYDGTIATFPQTGKEARFDSLLNLATRTRVELYRVLDRNFLEAYKKGWLDFPYSGFEEAGQDWVAGRSRSHFILYLPDAEEVARLCQAQVASAFSISGMERVRTGYNLVQCDAQYTCSVRSWSDSILVELGSTEAYFNPPSETIRPPNQWPMEMEIPSGGLEKFAGRFEYMPFRPVFIVHERNRLWAEIPGHGIHLLQARDSSNFFSSFAGLQLKFSLDTLVDAIKLQLITPEGQAVCVRKPEMGDLGLKESIGRVRALSETPIGVVDTVLTERIGGAYEFGKDTLRVSWNLESEILALDLSGNRRHSFHPGVGEYFISRDSDMRVRFDSGVAGRINGALLETASGTVFLPRLGNAPVTHGDLFPGFDPGNFDTIASQSGGSGYDTFRDLLGRERYGCSQDARFLAPGDGALVGLRQGQSADSISLAEGGDALVFRLDGAMGKAAIIELVVCGESRKGTGRVLVRAEGGAAEPGNRRLLAEDRWLPVAEKAGKVLIGPFPVPEEVYFVTVSRLAAPTTARAFAVDGYRILIGDAGMGRNGGE